MSDTLTSTKSMPVRHGAADLQILAQVEKWMATIREINRDDIQIQAEPTFRVRLRPAPAPVTE